MLREGKWMTQKMLCEGKWMTQKMLCEGKWMTQKKLCEGIWMTRPTGPIAFHVACRPTGPIAFQVASARCLKFYCRWLSPCNFETILNHLKTQHTLDMK